MTDHEMVVRDICHNHHSCYINTNYSIYLEIFISYKCNSYYLCWILKVFQYLTIFLFVSGECAWSLTNSASLSTVFSKTEYKSDVNSITYIINTDFAWIDWEIKAEATMEKIDLASFIWGMEDQADMYCMCCSMSVLSSALKALVTKSNSLCEHTCY